MIIGNNLVAQQNATVGGTLTVNGTASIGSDTTISGQVTSTGAMNAPAFNKTSDYRLKSEISPLLNAIPLLMKLSPKQYNMQGKIQEGLIAHELQEILSNAVTGEKDAYDDKGQIIPQKVDYSYLIVWLLAGLQEQQKKIEDLQNQINTLNNAGNSQENL